MRLGTRSLLFGVHQFILHPFWVAVAWWKLYGFPWDPRLWVAFFVHDWGYWGKTEMDGPIGDRHPELGARIMHALFDRIDAGSYGTPGESGYSHWYLPDYKWRDFCLLHSRSMSKIRGKEPSPLCIADKYVMCLEPWWMYIPRAWATGELQEYMRMTDYGFEGSLTLHEGRQWYVTMRTRHQKYVEKEVQRLKESLQAVEL